MLLYFIMFIAPAMTPEAPMVLLIPGLDQIPNGEYSLTVPIKDDSVRVGFRGTPDRFGKVDLLVSPDRIRISRKDGDLQVVSNTLDKTGDRPSIIATEVLVVPEPALEVRRIDDRWTTEGNKVASRLGLARFAAKVSEAAIRKAQKTQVKSR